LAVEPPPGRLFNSPPFPPVFSRSVPESASWPASPEFSLSDTVSQVRWSSVVETWGSTPHERQALYPCDELVESTYALFRAVDIDAPASVVFRWLCQLRKAPYSYDWLDNAGRRSPRQLADGLDHLETGQRFITIFRLASFEYGRSITLDSNTPFFGRVVVTYQVGEVNAHKSRLVVKVILSATAGLRGQWVTKRILPAGDLLMMRKQLLTLKALAERDARRPVTWAPA
jgi:hypothetical protein